MGVTEAEMTEAIVAKLRDAAGEMFAAEVEAAVAKLAEGLERHGIEVPETLTELRIPPTHGQPHVCARSTARRDAD